jgi:hypothetical protein
MVERFYFYCTTENWGLHNRKLGFAQPKTGVCTTENWGLHNRKLGFAQPKTGVCTTENWGFFVII